MTEWILIVVFSWSMAYRGEQRTPTMLGVFKTQQACLNAARALANNGLQANAICAPTTDAKEKP